MLLNCVLIRVPLPPTHSQCKIQLRKIIPFIACLHAAATHMDIIIIYLRVQAVLVARPGTSGR